LRSPDWDSDRQDTSLGRQRSSGRPGAPAGSAALLLWLSGHRGGRPVPTPGWRRDVFEAASVLPGHGLCVFPMARGLRPPEQGVGPLI